MDKLLFTNSEIIIVIKECMVGIEKELHGEQEEDFYLPKPIMDKIDFLSNEDREEFFDNCDEIAKRVLKLKTGELNEINMIHNEIRILANESLKNYLNKK